MNATLAELKGSILRGVLRDAKETTGGIPGLMEKMPAEHRKEYFAFKIYHGSWYSYVAFTALLDAFSGVPGQRGAIAFQELGKRMAIRDFTTLFKAYALVSTPTRLAGVPRKIWLQRFRNAGTASSTPGDRNFRFTIAGFPDMHPMQCQILTGYGLAVGRQKTKTFANSHDRCVHRGDKDCSWLSTW